MDEGYVWERIVGNLKFKKIAASLAIIGGSAMSADAASVVYDSNGGNGVNCSFGPTCSVVLTGSDAAAGATLTIGIDQDAALNDNMALEFAPHGVGLGIGFLEDGNDPTLSLFAAAITLTVDRDVTWIGGAFSSVQANSPEQGSTTTTAVDIAGSGLSTTLFEMEPIFNTAPGNDSLATPGFMPQTFSLVGQGIEFEALQTYTLTLRDFALAVGDLQTMRPNNQTFLQFSSMEFVSTATVPLPATAWMMIGALGFLGWRKYRAA